MPRFVDQAHVAVRTVVCPGEIVIDATAGGGRDTLFLAQLVGPTGKVHAFDVQPNALAQTSARLEAAGVKNVTLHQRSHAELCSTLSAEVRGQVAAVMFNLGYLPGSQSNVTTTLTDTLSGLQESLAILRPGGLLSVLAYRGHSGGAEEAAAVREFFNARLAELSSIAISGEERISESPLLYVAYRR